MRSNLSPVAGVMGDRGEFRESGTASKAGGTVDDGGNRPLGPETAGELAEIAYPRPLQDSEQEPKRAGVSIISAETARPAVETQFDRIVDSPASASTRVAATPRRSVKERLRRPLMLALPIVLAAFGGAYYLA